MVQTIEIDKKEYAVIPKKMLEKKMQQIEDMQDTIDALKYEQKKSKQFIRHEELKKIIKKME